MLASLGTVLRAYFTHGFISSSLYPGAIGGVFQAKHLEMENQRVQVTCPRLVVDIGFRGPASNYDVRISLNHRWCFVAMTPQFTFQVTCICVFHFFDTSNNLTCTEVVHALEYPFCRKYNKSSVLMWYYKGKCFLNWIVSMVFWSEKDYLNGKLILNSIY